MLTLKPKFTQAFRNFFKLEASSAIILLGASFLALLFANSPLAKFYDTSLHHTYGGFTLYHSINDGLMTLFFLLVSLEIKRELIIGELNQLSKALLPIIAAVGGMVVPAIIFLAVNYHHPATLSGWAIPCATDIAFSLAILHCLGSRVPLALRIFLTALAIIDDLGSILIIAVFYTAHIQIVFLLLAAVCTLGLCELNRRAVKNLWPYLLLGLITWLCVLNSGVHATVAGVILAFTIPLSLPTKNISPLTILEKNLHPWVAFLVLPLFAFSNAGLSLQHFSWANILAPLPLGIILGLFFGKQFGIFTTTWLTIKCGFAKLPYATNWQQLYGVSLLCGIGFTMSLFIGLLAFANDSGMLELVKLGVFIGSFLSAVAGYFILRFSKNI